MSIINNELKERNMQYYSKNKQNKLKLFKK